MKSLAMKSLAILLSLSLLLSSCRVYNDKTKDKPVTRDFLSSLKPGKYQFELKTGLVQYVEITVVGADSIVGFTSPKGSDWRKVSYSSSFDTIEKNVAKISHKEFTRTQLIFGIVVVSAVTVTLLITWAISFSNNCCF